MSHRSLRFKVMLIVGALVSITLGIIFFWMFQQSKKNIMDQIDMEARTLLQQIVLTRQWVSDKGGLFLRKGPGVETNPYLPGTDINDTDGRSYVFRNPAAVTRELSQYANASGEYWFHISSFKPKKH